jgi:outer membrane protein assembly factor BamB
MLAKASLFLVAATAAAGDWPQWRGPDRSNVSAETGLLKEWPANGPPMAWKADGFGEGVGGVAIAEGRIYLLGYRDDSEFVTALGVKDGKPVWATKIGPAAKEASIMRWLSQRTPTVDGDRLYVLTANGELVCLDTTGKEQWRKHYVKDFEGRRGNWGFCDFPLVDGDKLICTPGGDNATMVALNKKTGELIWKCAVDGGDSGTHSAVVAADIDGTRQYINQLNKGTLGVSADGKLLWRYTKMGPVNGNVYTAMINCDEVFCLAGWNGGIGLIRPVKDGDAFKIEERYATRTSLQNWIGSAVRVGDHVYICAGNGGPTCIDWGTGKSVWGPIRTGGSGQGTMTYADGHLYLRYYDGKVFLAEANPKGLTLKNSFEPPRAAKEPAWSFPVIADGRLYLRDQGTLLCYDIQEKKEGRRRAPDAIFVPTPQDVVERMLELAAVKREDLVYDLGCGDGRFVVTAAKQHGCKAIGVDLDPECIKSARDNVKKNGVEALVRIAQDDIFQVDLSKADVVMLYLLPALNVKLIPQLEKMKPGARIVSHQFDMHGVMPDKVIKVVSSEDMLERSLYLWTLPLKKEKQKD